MSVKIFLAICLAIAVVESAQVFSPEKCLEGLRKNIQEYASSLQSLGSEFTQSISGSMPGFDAQGFSQDVSGLTDGYMQLASSLSSFNLSDLMSKQTELAKKQMELISKYLMNFNMNPMASMNAMSFIQKLAELNMKYMSGGLLSPSMCMQEQGGSQ